MALGDRKAAVRGSAPLIAAAPSAATFTFAGKVLEYAGSRLFRVGHAAGDGAAGSPLEPAHYIQRGRGRRGALALALALARLSLRLALVRDRGSGPGAGGPSPAPCSASGASMPLGVLDSWRMPPSLASKACSSTPPARCRPSLRVQQETSPHGP